MVFGNVVLVSPSDLLKSGVKVFKTLQQAGEFILTVPGSYQAGFSTGFNIQESINFASSSWIPHGLK
jgi:hypothetical protein